MPLDPPNGTMPSIEKQKPIVPPPGVGTGFTFDK
jgi:hypothetical protein